MMPGTDQERQERMFVLRLRLARIAAGFETAKDLADKLKVNPNLISSYERGATQPPAFERELGITISRLASELKVHPNFLLEGKTAGITREYTDHLLQTSLLVAAPKLTARRRRWVVHGLSIVVVAALATFCCTGL
jgi:transcriptional regulator with XRE-family HTH domain